MPNVLVEWNSFEPPECHLIFSAFLAVDQTLQSIVLISRTMAPSKAGLSAAQKLEKILDFFRDSRTCHTLKDLESALPSAASVHKMQVKDLIKELTDENKVKVEKIGSGNWYWCWAGEEAQEKKKAIRNLEMEKAKLDQSNTSTEERVQALREEQSAAQEDTAHQEFLEQLGSLEDEVRKLVTEKDEWENTVAEGIEGTRAATEGFKSSVVELTDCIYTLESHLQSLLNGDRETMELIKRDCYGPYYVEDEGLPELEGI